MDKLIVDSPGGDRWQLCTDENKRLILKSGEVLKSVMENSIGDFDGVFNSSGIFYIAAANSEGGIDCLVFDGENTRQIPVVSGKSGVSQISGIRILCINNRFSLWYCLEYESDLLLVNQFFDSQGKADAPFAVDRLSGRKCFSVCCDADFNTNVFYKDKDGRSRYLKYCWNQKKFEAGTDGLFGYDDVVSISSVCDEDKIHLVFVARRSDYYGVYYKNTESAQETVLGFGVGAGCSTAVCSDGGSVRVYWTDNYESCECLSTDGGKTFGKPKRINFSGDKVSLWGYRNSGNTTGLYREACMYSEGNGRILHENEAPAYAGKQSDKITEMSREIIDYAGKNASEIKVGIDIAARLESIETQLMKIVYILEESKNDIKKCIGGNDNETV